MTINTRVQPSEYALRGKRDYWLSCGGYTQKQAAKQAYEQEKAKRGTITQADETGVTVRWDNGTISSCLRARVTPIDDTTPTLSDNFKVRPWLNTPIRKPSKSVTDLPLFLGEKEKHEARQEEAQAGLWQVSEGPQ